MKYLLRLAINAQKTILQAGMDKKGGYYGKTC